jgi:hypothetical protein
MGRDCGWTSSATPDVRYLCLLLWLFTALSFVVIFHVFFEVSLLVEVRLRGSLSARSAIPNPVSRQHPCRYRRARCVLRFLLFFFLVQQQNSKLVTSL